jgi:hypothetical protein
MQKEQAEQMEGDPSATDTTAIDIAKEVFGVLWMCFSLFHHH